MVNSSDLNQDLNVPFGLPEEILSCILQLSIGTYDDINHDVQFRTATPLRLRLVCRQWLGVLERSPRFWGLMLAVAKGREAWQGVLAKCKSAPVVLSTRSGLPIATLEAHIGRALEVYLDNTGDGGDLGSVWASGEPLPQLRILHLACHDLDSPPTIVAPNLEELKINRSALVRAPSLRQLELRKLHRDMLPLLASTVAEGSQLHELVISGEEEVEYPTWRACLDTIAGCHISTFVATIGFLGSIRPIPDVVLPSLTTLCLRVPAIIHSSRLEIVDACLSVPQLRILLSSIPSVRVLKLSSQKRAQRRTGTPERINLPRCESITIADRHFVDDALTQLLESIYAPLLRDMQLRTRPYIINRVRPNNYQSEDRAPPCLVHDMATVTKRICAARFTSLSPAIEALTHGPVDLIVDTDCSTGSSAAITFTARDNYIRTSRYSGLRILNIMDGTYCGVRHQHTQLISVVYMLNMFAWPAVSCITVNSPTPLLETDGEELLYPDPFVTVSNEEKTSLRHNLLRMTGVCTLNMQLTKVNDQSGVALIRALSEPPDAVIWPKLRHIHIILLESSKGGPDCMGRWWDDFMVFVLRRKAACSPNLPLPIQVTIEGSDEYMQSDIALSLIRVLSTLVEDVKFL
ncbi:unnamed protein product [Peniophora sp. CBMAI 1063]|nr:unnamed protein product [Peniophora sp. CBMAI 1063]